MVNEIGFRHRHQVLDILRNARKPVSGEFLGRELGISRVAVHKHIKSLREYGYSIQTGRRGYQVETVGSNGILSPWEFKENENVLVYSETGSTMDRAREAAERLPQENITIVAEKQSGGRRRDGGSWVSRPGGLWATRVLHATSSSHRITRFTLAACAALASVLRDTFDVDARLRWPGDVVINGLKIAGAMSEARIIGERFAWIALGMGINVNNEVYPSAAVSLKALTGKMTDRPELLRGWTTALNSLYASGEIESDEIPSWWNNRMDGIGRETEFRVFDSFRAGAGGSTAAGQVNGVLIKGRIEGVDGLGRLCLKTTSGSNIALAAGDVLEIHNNKEDINAG